MSYALNDTICAIASASGGAARGVIRISGADAIEIAARLFRSDAGQPIERFRRATAVAGRLRFAFDAQTEATKALAAANGQRRDLGLPCDLFLWPTARSYTRQPVAELHTIGSPPLLEALVAALCRAGARLAEPGEFTLRAFLSGRIDLTQAEAVLGVIDAGGDEQLSGALAQLAGGLATPLYQLRSDLLQLLAELEAGLDFVEEDIQFISPDELLARLGASRELLRSVAEQIVTRHTSDRALQVALVGPPNVGKSSLFNALVARRSLGRSTAHAPTTPALVSPQRGTTRDYLTATIDLDGVACQLVDTAGIDETQPDQEIDRFARALTAEQSGQAALRVCCIETTESHVGQQWSGSECDMIARTKSDIAEHVLQRPPGWPADVPVVRTSSRTGEGLDELCAALRQLLTRGHSAQAGQVVAATANRCRESVRLADAALHRAIEIALGEGGEELIAAELRIALSELGKVVGAVYTDDLLDRIFRTFCIGK